MVKNTVQEIKERFDHDVERFSNLETGQASTIDAPLSLDLITRAAAACTPHATDILDIGCGAGNYSVKLLGLLPKLHCTLLDLSLPMLHKAKDRVEEAGGVPHIIQGDIREVNFAPESVDIILAGAVFHHLRTDDEWEAVFKKCYATLKKGGCLWISDLVEHSQPSIQALMWQRYGEYLTDLKDDAYQKHVFDYIAKEDSPKPLIFQVQLLQKVGFSVDILHKNSVFATFGGIK